MPLVLPRGNSNLRPEDVVLLRMKNESIRHRSRRLAPTSRAAAEIEYKQNAAYERTSKRPYLPQPRVPDSPGYSTPEWDGTRACWLVYDIKDTTKWMAWDAFQEKWVDIAEFDKSCSTPPGLQKNESMNSSNETTTPNSSGASSDRPKFTLKAVALSVIRMLALQRRASEPAI